MRRAQPRGRAEGRRRSLVALVPTLAVVTAGAVGAATHLLVVSGLGGEESYSTAFHDWSAAVVDSAIASGVAPERVVYLAEDPARDPERIDGESRREAVVAALERLGTAAGADGELWLVIFAHGSTRGGDATVNLPGPDLAASELAAVLDRLPVKTVVVANASSASGDFVRTLSAPGRAIVTATRSASERHAPLFGGYFAEGFEDDKADVDKDDRVSLLEAFDYARLAVGRAYEGDGRMATEHPMLDDDGDRKGSFEPNATAEGDGRVASRLFLGDTAAEAQGSPELERLLERRRRLEDRVSELRARSGALEESLYLEELEGLLLELARTNEEIEQARAAAVSGEGP